MKILQCCLISGMMFSSVGAVARDVPDVELQSGQQAQIQLIGQSVLKAMRAAEPAPERDPVIAHITSMKQQIGKMAQIDASLPLSLEELRGVQGLTVPRALSAASETQAELAMQSFRGRMDALKTETQSLREASASIGWFVRTCNAMVGDVIGIKSACSECSYRANVS